MQVLPGVCCPALVEEIRSLRSLHDRLEAFWYKTCHQLSRPLQQQRDVLREQHPAAALSPSLGAHGLSTRVLHCGLHLCWWCLPILSEAALRSALRQHCFPLCNDRRWHTIEHLCWPPRDNGSVPNESCLRMEPQSRLHRECSPLHLRRAWFWRPCQLRLLTPDQTSTSSTDPDDGSTL